MQLGNGMMRVQELTPWHQYEFNKSRLVEEQASSSA